MCHHFESVTAQIYLENLRNTYVVAILIAMAVHRHQPSTRQISEQHTVTVIGRSNGLRLLHPGAIECTALGVCHALCKWLRLCPLLTGSDVAIL